MQNFRALGASPPDPHWPPAARGPAPRPPKQPPHCEFLATRLVTLVCSPCLPLKLLVQVFPFLQNPGYVRNLAQGF